MNEQLELDAVTRERLFCVEQHARSRLIGCVRDFQLMVHDDGLVLRGHAHSYYGKQLAQEAIMQLTELPIRSNEIEVC